MSSSESVIHDIVSKVTSKDVRRKKDNKPIKIYTIETRKGLTLTTALKETATAAYALRGEQVDLWVKVEQNGKFINKYLQAISRTKPEYELPSDDIPTDDPIPQEEPRDMSRGLPEIPDTTKENDEKIWRQVAAKVSAQISSSPTEFWDNLDDLMIYFETGRKPNGFQKAQDAEANQFIPEGAVAAGGSYFDENAPTDSDIPF